jgi:hypothetical protein
MIRQNPAINRPACGHAIFSENLAEGGFARFVYAKDVLKIACQICSGLLCLHELHIQCDRDLFAHHNAAGLKRGVPGQAEILAIDFGGRRYCNASVAPRIS